MVALIGYLVAALAVVFAFNALIWNGYIEDSGGEPLTTWPLALVAGAVGIGGFLATTWYVRRGRRKPDSLQ